MDVRCLGPVRVLDGDQEPVLGGPKPRLLFARLLVDVRQEVTTDQLIDAVWESRPPASARNTLQTYVAHLRRALGTSRIVGRGTGYTLRLDDEEVDARRFARLVDAGRAQLGSDADEACRQLEAALGLWRGDPFGDLHDAASLASEVARLEALRLRALEARSEAELAAGRPADAVAALEAATASHPLHERLWELLVLALYRSGRQADALAAYRRARELMREEVGVDPSATLRALHDRVLSQDPGLEAPHRGPPATRLTTGAELGPRPSFPRPLAIDRHAPYVGRGDVLEALSDAWRAVADRGGRGVLLTGEPGVGKTRTAAELARSAYDGGAIVLCGRCDDHLGVPFQPLAEALDHQTHHAPSLPLGRLEGELVRLLPDLARRRPQLPSPVASDPRVERHRLFDAVASWLREVSQVRPVLLVVEDLHWATGPTAQLLAHLVRSLVGDPDARVLLLCTFRDTEVATADEVAGTLAELARSPHVERIAVDPLSVAEVRELVVSLAGGADDPTTRRLARYTHADAGGNPFLVGELLRHLLETGRASLVHGRWQLDDPGVEAVPARVRDVVAQRVRQLPDRARRVLPPVAVLGPDAELRVLTEMVDEDAAEVLDGVDVALRAGLVEEHGPDQLRFAHELVRAAVLTELSGPRRRRLHAAAADALERVRPERVTAIADHVLRAGAAVAPARAVRVAVDAGERAQAQGATGEAVRWFGRACGLDDGTSALDRRWSLRARCGLGEAQRDLGDPAHRDTLLTAARDALAGDHLDLAVRAAVANHRPTTVSAVGEVDDDRIAVLERVLDQLGPDAQAASDLVDARIRILTLLSLELTFAAVAPERRLSLADEADALARQHGDDRLQAWVAATLRIPLTVADRAGELPQLLRRAVDRADRSGDPALRCATRVSGHQALLGIGEVAEARRLAEDALQLAESEAAPFLQLLARFNTVQYRAYGGDLAGAREDNQRCLAFGQTLGEPDPLVWWGAIEGLLAILDGTLPHLTDALGGFADASPRVPAWRAAHVLALTLGGREDEARKLIACHGLDRPDTLPDDWLRFSGLMNLACTAFELRDPAVGAATLQALTPYPDLWAHCNVFCQGPVTLGVGLAAGGTGQLDRSVAALQDACTALRERGLRSHLPWASWYLARARRRRGAPGDEDAARQVAAEGLELARTSGMPVLAERLEDLSGGHGALPGDDPAG